MVAGVGFWDTGGRALGLYSLLLSIAMVAFAVWFAAHALPAGVIVTLVVAVPFFLQFLEFTVPYRAITVLTGYLLLLAGIISAAAGLAVYMSVLA